MSFIEEAIRELLAARRVLIASYAFGYYVEGNQARRMFENMQVHVHHVMYIHTCMLTVAYFHECCTVWLIRLDGCLLIYMFLNER